MHGPFAAWHENGKKRGEANYVDGKWHRLSTDPRENGQKAGEGNFENGKKVE